MEIDIFGIEELAIKTSRELEKHNIRLEITREKSIEYLISLIRAKEIIGEMEARISRNSFITGNDVKKIMDGLRS